MPILICSFCHDHRPWQQGKPTRRRLREIDEVEDSDFRIFILKSTCHPTFTIFLIFLFRIVVRAYFGSSKVSGWGANSVNTLFDVMNVWSAASSLMQPKVALGYDFRSS